MPNNETTAVKGKNKWAFPVGIIVLLFVLVGLVATIWFGVTGIQNLTENSKKRQEYQEFIIPVVMNDPAPFDDLSQANAMELMESAMWALLRSDVNPDEYAYEDGYMVIPQEDVKKQFVRLFGTDIEPVFATIISTSYEFTYDEATKTYRVPITSTEPLYTPVIYDVDHKGKTTVLTVGYLAANQWAQNTNGDMVAPEADKFMKITLREKSDAYYISAIQVTDRPDEASTKEPLTEATTAAPATQAPTEAPQTEAPQTEAPQSEAAPATEAPAA